MVILVSDEYKKFWSAHFKKLKYIGTNTFSSRIKQNNQGLGWSTCWIKIEELVILGGKVLSLDFSGMIHNPTYLPIWEIIALNFSPAKIESENSPAKIQHTKYPKTFAN